MFYTTSEPGSPFAQHSKRECCSGFIRPVADVIYRFHLVVVWLLSGWPKANPANHKAWVRKGGAASLQRGNKMWRDDYGELHRINGPAVIESNGGETWYYHGYVDRVDGPAVIVYYNGRRVREEWRRNDMLHRRNGPAVIMFNEAGIRIREEWWLNNRLHRENGPAVKEFEVYGYDEWSDDDRYNGEQFSDDWRGDLTQEWWVNGECQVSNDYYDDDSLYNVWWSECFD